MTTVFCRGKWFADGPSYNYASGPPKRQTDDFSRDGLTEEMWINTFGVNDYQGLPGGLYTTLEKFKALKGLVDIFELCDGNFHLSSLNFSIYDSSRSIKWYRQSLRFRTAVPHHQRGPWDGFLQDWISFNHSNVKCIGFCPNIGGSNWIYMGIS